MPKVLDAIQIVEAHSAFFLSPFRDPEEEALWRAVVQEATSSCIDGNIVKILEAMKTMEGMDRSEDNVFRIMEYWINHNPELYDTLIRLDVELKNNHLSSTIAEINSESSESHPSVTLQDDKAMLDKKLLYNLEKNREGIFFINRLINQGADVNPSDSTLLPLQAALLAPEAEDVIRNLLEKGALLCPERLLPRDPNMLKWAERHHCNPTYITILKEAMENKTPTQSIPKKIHFIWLGDSMPEEYLNNIEEWSKLSNKSDYTVTLWTDEATLSNASICEKLAKQGVVLKHWRDRGQEPNEINQNIDALITDIIETGKKDGHSQNYAACSDVLRISILEQEGGLYVDTDNSLVTNKDEPIGDINVVSQVGARFIETSTGFNQCFIAALPHTQPMRELLRYFSDLYSRGMDALPYPDSDFSRLKLYPQYNTQQDAREKVNPQPSNPPNSAAWWLTKTGYFHGVDYALGTHRSQQDEVSKIRFCSTMATTGPTIIKHYYEPFQLPSIDSSMRSFPRNGQDQAGAATYQITDTLIASDGQHGTWQLDKTIKTNNESINQPVNNDVLFYKDECQHLLSSISINYANPDDHTLNRYIKEQSIAITNSVCENELATILQNLINAGEALSSKEVQYVKEAVLKLRESNSSFLAISSRGTTQKIIKIERALYSVPVLERKTLMSTSNPCVEVRALQKELARHRQIGKAGKVYKTNGTIDEKNAAQSFRTIKEKLRKELPRTEQAEDQQDQTKGNIGKF